jgi:hypothetical protein
MLSQTDVGTSSEYEPVLGCSLSLTSLEPTVGVVFFRVDIDFGVVEGGVRGWDDHSALGNLVFGSNIEALFDLIRNHENGGTISKLLLDDSTGVDHLIDHVDVEPLVGVTVSDSELLLADLGQNVGSVGENLELPSRRARGGVLRSKEESEDSHRNLLVREPANHHWLGTNKVLLLFLRHLLILPRLDHRLDPEIHSAGRFLAGLHGLLRHFGTTGKFLDHKVGALLSVPCLGVRDDDGEVDEFQSSGNFVIVLRDVGDGLVADVSSAESPQRYGAVDVTEFTHVLSRLPILRKLDPPLEVLVVDLLLGREVLGDVLASEQSVQTLAVIDVRLSIQEHPVAGTEDFLRDIDDAGINVHRRVEDLAREITSGRDDNESRKQSATAIGRRAKDRILVKDRNTTQGTTVPFCQVFRKLRINRLHKGAHEGNLEHGTGNAALVPDVLH